MLESLVEFSRQHGRQAEISLSGGDPWARDDFPEILGLIRPLRRSGHVGRLSIAGNPEAVCFTTIQAMIEAGVDSVRFSLDGLEAAHDAIRGVGSFRSTVAALELLRGVPIQKSVGMTIHRRNVGELLEVLRLAKKMGVRSVGFQPLLPVGGGAGMRDAILSPLELRAALLVLLQAYDSGFEPHDLLTHTLRHQPLFGRLFLELGRWEEYVSLRETAGGLSCGGPGLVFVVWPDGEVVLRRDMARLGYVPRDSFERIYALSAPLRQLDDNAFLLPYRIARQREFAKCRDCLAAPYCPPRLIGAYNTELHFAPNSACWVN